MALRVMPHITPAEALRIVREIPFARFVIDQPLFYVSARPLSDLYGVPAKTYGSYGAARNSAAGRNLPNMPVRTITLHELLQRAKPPKTEQYQAFDTVGFLGIYRTVDAAYKANPGINFYIQKVML
jgi:hypothetical protein